MTHTTALHSPHGNAGHEAQLKQAFAHSSSPSIYDQIVISGGGMAALFSAYRILQTAQNAGKKFKVVVIADKISAPVPAGNHIVPEIAGLYEQKYPFSDDAQQRLNAGMQDLLKTIAREEIPCRLSKGYEIKSRSEDGMQACIADVLDSDPSQQKHLRINSSRQAIRLAGYDYSFAVGHSGQINIPDLLHGLVLAIENMGGEIRLETTYQGQDRLENGNYIIHTSNGDIETTRRPLLATGGQHQRSLPDFPFDTKILWTGAALLGPLAIADRQKYAQRPMAFCDTNLAGDVLWGGMDEEGYVTFGYGAVEHNDDPAVFAADKEKLRSNIMRDLEAAFPAITKKYPASFIYGPEHHTKNGLPIVARLNDYDVMGGWGTVGIIPAFAIARDYADYVVNGSDEKLRLWESMQQDAPARPAPVSTLTL